MPDALRRVLVDTNVWVSAVINPGGLPAALLAAFRSGRFRLVVSAELLAELRDELYRERIRRRWRLSPDDVGELLDLLDMVAIEASITGDLHVCGDAEDDYLLETAQLTRTEIIVTRDDDLKRDPHLLAWAHDHGAEVLSVAQFLALLDNERD